MMYLGGKSRLAKRIGAAILENTNQRGQYIEPMIGGGSVFFELAPHFQKSFGGDIQEDLILMYRALADGWVPPDTVTEEEWRELRDSPPSALRAFAGFGCSFGGKFFGGYGRDRNGRRNFAAEARQTLVTHQRVMSNLPSAPLFAHGGYYGWSPPQESVVYLDPPYAGTTGYTSERAGVPKFDHDEFWATATRWAHSGVHVFVSEFNAPEGWTPIWERERSVGVGGFQNAGYTKKTDKLFVYGKGYK